RPQASGSLLPSAGPLAAASSIEGSLQCGRRRHRHLEPRVLVLAVLLGGALLEMLRIATRAGVAEMTDDESRFKLAVKDFVGHAVHLQTPDAVERLNAVPVRVARAEPP